MMKKLLIAVLAFNIVACSSNPKVQDERVAFTRSFSSPIHLPIPFSDMPTIPLKAKEERLLVISPDAYDKVRGTFKANRPKITLNYSITPIDENSYNFSYSGLVEYLSYQDISSYNGDLKIGGTVEHSTLITESSVNVKYGQASQVPLADGIVFDFEVDK